MDTETRRALLGRLHKLHKREREALFIRAEQLRTQRAAALLAAVPVVRRGRRAEEEEEVAKAKKVPSVQDVALEILARDPNLSPGLETATVLTVRKGRAIVSRNGERQDLMLSGDLTSRQQTEVAVGDEAIIINDRIEAIMPRRSELARSDPGAEIRRVIVANVDLVVHVVSVVAPPLHPRIIDRVRLAATSGRCDYAIAVNKTDLEGAEAELTRLDPYRDLGIPICQVSAHTGEGIAQLTALMATRTSAFVGHSGVGKSSLLNAIVGQELAATGVVSDGNKRGAHTTRQGTLWDLSETLGNGTRIIDTPGVRAFGIVPSEEVGVVDSFPEFNEFTCRFRNCTHKVEPDCGVLAAVEDGSLSYYRYESYLKLTEK